MNENYFCQEQFSDPGELDALKSLFLKSVDNVIIEISTYCNRACTYCPVSQVDRSTKNIPLNDERFERIVSDLEDIDYSGGVCLNLYNEPMADKKLLLSRISRVRTKVPNAKIYFSTNGDYLDDEYLQELSTAGLNELYVTLHTPKGQEYRDEYVIWRFSELSVRLNKLIKVDQFNHGHSLFGEVRLHGIALKVFSTNYYLYGTDRGGSVVLESMLWRSKKRASPCKRPFTDFTISYDGTVFPCCQFFADNEIHRDSYSIGNIDNYPTIFHIYGSTAMASWRSSLLTYGTKDAPCASCSESTIERVDRADVAMRRRVFRKYVNNKKSFFSRLLLWK